MTSARDNAELTRVGPGTLMGDLMRQYWIPGRACRRSSRPAAQPMRLLLLGEQLIAFRDKPGRVGIMDHRCPHRCASLFFGRTRRAGIRCVYHGWKFDAEGKCVDMPNVPPAADFKRTVKAKAYKVVERGGLIWTYMGPRAEAPPLPDIESLALPESERVVRCTSANATGCRRSRATSTPRISASCISAASRRDEIPADSLHRYNLIDRAPRYHVKDTDWGTMYTRLPAGRRRTGLSSLLAFHLPVHHPAARRHLRRPHPGGVWVPMDDTHTMVFTFFWTKRTRVAARHEGRPPDPGLGLADGVPAQHAPAGTTAGG